MKAAIVLMQQHKRLRYTFHYRHSHSIVGSHSKDTGGEAVAAKEIFNLGRLYHCSSKRSLDIAASLLLLASLPLHFLLVRNPVQFVTNCLRVLAGKNTWIGYHDAAIHLPALKPGILLPDAMPATTGKNLPEQSLKAMDQWYAKEYTWTKDVTIIAKRVSLAGK